MLKVIRDKATKEMRIMWEPAVRPNEIEPDVVLAPNEEFKTLTNMTHASAIGVAMSKSRGRPARIYVHDDRVEADEHRSAPVTP